MSSTLSKSMLIGACVVVCAAIVAQAQYNTFDSDPNSELGKLVRNSGKLQAQQNQRHQLREQHAATRNLLSQQPQQPFQFASNQNRRNYGSANPLNSYGLSMGAAASAGRGSNSEINDDDESSNFGPSNFNANFDSNNDADGEVANNQANADGQQVAGLNQAASGYPGQSDYSNEAAGAGFNFDGPSGYGPSSADGADFGPSEGFGSEGKRAKSASSPMSSRNFGSEEDAGAPQYGPNSAVNSDADETEGRPANYPSNVNGGAQAESDNDNDDE